MISSGKKVNQYKAEIQITRQQVGGVCQICIIFLSFEPADGYPLDGRIYITLTDRQGVDRSGFVD